jgi:hypothetical protein
MRLSRKFAGLMLAAAVALGFTTAAVPARASTSSPYWHIMTLFGSLPFPCMQGGPDGSLGPTVVQHYCDPTFANTAQLWLPVNQGGNVYKFVNIGTGLCLDAYVHGAPSNGAPIILANCNTANTNLRWARDVSASGGDPFTGTNTIQSRVSNSTGFCLDVPRGQRTLGLQLQLYQCNNTDAQYFSITQGD